MDQIKTLTLKFNNVDAIPVITLLDVSRASVEPIMAWYACYFSGDTYDVQVDGISVSKDVNGELVSTE